MYRAQKYSVALLNNILINLLACLLYMYIMNCSVHDLRIWAPYTGLVPTMASMGTPFPNALPVSIPSSMGRLGGGSTAVVWNRDSALVMQLLWQ